MVYIFYEWATPIFAVNKYSMKIMAINSFLHVWISNRFTMVFDQNNLFTVSVSTKNGM